MSARSINESISELTDKRISYINSTHDKRQLIFDGCRFCVKQKNLNSILWRYTRKDCSASVTVSNNDVILRINEIHNHLIEPNEINLLQLRHKLKREAQTTSTTINKIVETGYSELVTQAKITDAVLKFPTIKTLKDTVNKQRRKIRPSISNCIKDVPSPLLLLHI